MRALRWALVWLRWTLFYTPCLILHLILSEEHFNPGGIRWGKKSNRSLGGERNQEKPKCGCMLGGEHTPLCPTSLPQFGCRLIVPLHTGRAALWTINHLSAINRPPECRVLGPNFLSRFSAVWLCYAWVCSSLYLSYLGCTVLLISVTNIFTKLGNFQLLFLHIVFARFSLLLELQLHVIRKLGINLMYVRLLNVDFFFSNLFFFRLGDVYICLQVSRSCLL